MHLNNKKVLTKDIVIDLVYCTKKGAGAHVSVASLDCVSHASEIRLSQSKAA